MCFGVRKTAVALVVSRAPQCVFVHPSSSCAHARGYDRHETVYGSLEAPSAVDEHIKCVHVLRAVLRKVVTPRFPGTYWYFTCRHIFVNKKTCYMWTRRHDAIFEHEDMTGQSMCEQEDMTFEHFFTCHFLFSWNPSFSSLQIPSSVCEALRYQCERPQATNLWYKLWKGVVCCPNIHALLISCLVTTRICTS